MSEVHLQSPPADRWGPELFGALGEAPSRVAAVSLLFSRGVPVFPCVPGGKRPLIAHGFQDASTDLSVIGPWWTRWPDANIGVPTGAASGVDVVDIDVHPTGSGFDAFEQARAEGLVDGWSWLVRTPSGGVHAYFLHNPGREQRSWQAPRRHIDFRGDGGYIVLPPSAVADADGVGGVYRQIAVARHHEPRPVDAGALRAFLDPPKPVTRPADMPAVGARPDRLAAWVAARPQGCRNTGLFWAACRMSETRQSFQLAVSLLGRAARDAGLSERESLTTIQSAYRAAPPQTTVPAGATRAVEAVAR